MRSIFASLLLAVALIVYPFRGEGGTAPRALAAPTAPAGRLSVQATALGAAFSYQGQLRQDNAPVTDSCDMLFELFDSASGGSRIGSAIAQVIAVSNGIFKTELDFGGEAFTGEARWLDLQVRCPAGSGAYTPLDPRQPVAAVPYALSLRPGAVISSTGGIGLRVSSGDTAIWADSSAGVGVQGATQTGQGVRGDSGGNGVGVLGYSLSGYGVQGDTTTGPAGVHGSSRDGSGVEGTSTNGFAMRALGNTAQEPDKGGWVKAMAYVEPDRPDGQQIVRCFNSQQTGLAVSTAPCGLRFARASAGVYLVGFGFTTNDRFVSVTPVDTLKLYGGVLAYATLTLDTIVEVDTRTPAYAAVDAAFVIIVY